MVSLKPNEKKIKDGSDQLDQMLLTRLLTTRLRNTDDINDGTQYGLSKMVKIKLD